MEILALVGIGLLLVVAWAITSYVALWINVGEMGQPPIVLRHGGTLGLFGLLMLAGGGVLLYRARGLAAVLFGLGATWIIGRALNAGQRQDRDAYYAIVAKGQREADGSPAPPSPRGSFDRLKEVEEQLRAKKNRQSEE